MKHFHLSNKGKRTITLHAPIDGELIPIEEVNDPSYSRKMMGNGFAVKDTSGPVYSPGKGRVVNIFPTKHAFGIEMENGVEVLVHIGIDTSELEGVPFETKVKAGDIVDEQTILTTIDHNMLIETGKENIVLVVLTDMNEIETFSVHSQGRVKSGEKIGNVSRK